MELPVEVAKKRKEAKSRKDKELRNKLNKEFQNIVRNDKKQCQAFKPALEKDK